MRLPERVLVIIAAGLLCFTAVSGRLAAQSPPGVPALYTQVEAFTLGGGMRAVDNLTLTRDRVEMTFDGTFYFQTPIDGQVYGAVFVGDGTFRSAVDTLFDRANTERLTDEESIESDFDTAVLRFSDDTFDLIGPATAGPAPGNAQGLADNYGEETLKETGINVSARLAAAILNESDPGFFIAEFDGGDLHRFSFVFDQLARVPTVAFGIDAGEKGLIYSNEDDVLGNDVFATFFSAADVAAGTASYADEMALVDVEHYAMDIDVTNPRDRVGVEATIDLTSRVDGLRAIQFTVGESLSEQLDERREKGMRLVAARMEDGAALEAVQDEWEGGLTVFLPEAIDTGDEITLVIEVEGDFLETPDTFQNFSPLEGSQWYPRHGYLDFATYEMTFHHNGDQQIATAGATDRGVDDGAGGTLTRAVLDDPEAAVTFGVGSYEILEEDDLIEGVRVEFYSPKGRVNFEDFIAAEMGNAANFLSQMLGPYPFDEFTGGQNQRQGDQSRPRLMTVTLPNQQGDTALRDTYVAVAHQVTHQWLGNLVTPRSYRDEWLSEGLAGYAGLLYAEFRQGERTRHDLIERSREQLIRRAQNMRGLGDDRIVDVGPLDMGIRLQSSESQGVYGNLMRNKAPLVFRMLHYLFSHPTTGDDQAFYLMLQAFIETHRDNLATTSSFQQVANAVFAQTAMAQVLGVSNLDWFFQEWVYGAYLPSYRMEYSVTSQDDGSFVAQGNIFQEDVPDGFAMALPVTLRFAGNQVARWYVFAQGEERAFQIPLPAQPEGIELDPDWWVLTDDTSTRRR